MPLNRESGERLEGLNGQHIVIDYHRLAEMTNLLTEYKVKKKFGYATKQRTLFDDAVAHAVDAFKEAGALYPVRIDDEDVLVQVYPSERVVAVLFQRKIAGNDHYVTRLYDLPPPIIKDLLEGKKVVTH
jgi:hypothetical protein